ncbi:MAG: PEP-CTERM sorting domain-containing protein [Planctomycetota bacterium]
MIARFAAPVLLTAVAAAPTSAAVIGTYNFDNTNGAISAPASKSIDVQPDDATFSDFVVVGVNEVTGGKGASNAGRLGTDGWNTANQSFDANKYVGFTLTADTGFVLDLNEFSMGFGVANDTNNTGDGFSPRDLSVIARTSATGSFTEIINQNDIQLGSNAFTTFTANLTAIADTDFFEVRIRAADPDIASRPARFDNISIDAQVIPEPASLGLVAAGLGVVLPRRRRPGR